MINIEERNILIKKHYNDFIHIFHKIIRNYDIDYDECFSDAQLAFVKAIDSYNPSLGNSLTTHIYNGIKFTLWNHISQRRRRINRLISYEELSRNKYIEE